MLHLIGDWLPLYDDSHTRENFAGYTIKKQKYTMRKEDCEQNVNQQKKKMLDVDS